MSRMKNAYNRSQMPEDEFETLMEGRFHNTVNGNYRSGTTHKFHLSGPPKK